MSPSTPSQPPTLPRVVAFGGGTGLPVLLEGLRERDGDRTTAVVTVADDGGSSGRLRRELGMPPPGDVRNCLVAMASRRRLAEVFSYRFEEGAELRDHSVGNLIIAALVDMAGGFTEGVEQAGRFLRIKGRVLPAATESLTLVIEDVHGIITRGESTVRAASKIARVRIEPEGAQAPPEVAEAIAGADVVVLAPGSLFTSTIPALLGAGVAEALASYGGPVVYVSNVMTQPGETTGFSVSDHVRAIRDHVGAAVTDVVVHAERLSEASIRWYEAVGAGPVAIDREATERLGARVWERAVLAESTAPGIRHDPDRVAEAVLEVAGAARSRPPVSPPS